MLFGALGASLIRSMLSGKIVTRDDDKVARVGERVIRANQGF